MDPFTGHRLSADFVAGYGGPVCHGPELLPASLFLAARRSDGGRHRCLPSAVGQAAGVHLPPFALIRKVLNEFFYCQGTHLTLIAPFGHRKSGS